MLYGFARLLQLLGLLILPVAMAGNVTNPDRMDLKSMLVLSGIGIGIFFLGWLIQQQARR